MAKTAPAPKGKPKADTKKTKKPRPKKSPAREWLDALVYAGLAALVIRLFFVEAFLIPSASMERSLLVGDFLFVSKFHYGTRLPMVPLSVPFIHNTIPGTTKKSYLDWVELPYSRLPGLTSIQRGDVIVFNYPANDIHQLDGQPWTVQQTAVKENYIKRCQGIPGDTLSIRDRRVFINGQAIEQPEDMQFRYDMYTNGVALNPKFLQENGFRAVGDLNANVFEGRSNRHYLMDMTPEKAASFSSLPFVDTLAVNNEPKGATAAYIYPNQYYDDTKIFFPWNRDNYGPIVIPARGMQIELNAKNIMLYKRCITAYEGHTMQLSGNEVLVDGEPATHYTFQMDYYWAMGDNRHNSEDSRIWGFVPEDHIVGKPLFVVANFRNFSWSRFFMGID